MRLICTHCSGTGVVRPAELPSDQRRLLEVLQAAKRGATVEALILDVYGDRALLDSRWSLHMLIKRLNRRLLNARIIADRKGPGARYHLAEGRSAALRRCDSVTASEAAR